MRPLNLVGIINEAVTKKKLLLTLLSSQRKKNQIHSKLPMFHCEVEIYGIHGQRGNDIGLSRSAPKT